MVEVYHRFAGRRAWSGFGLSFARRQPVDDQKVPILRLNKMLLWHIAIYRAKLLKVLRLANLLRALLDLVARLRTSPSIWRPHERVEHASSVLIEPVDDRLREKNGDYARKRLEK